MGERDRGREERGERERESYSTPRKESRAVSKSGGGSRGRGEGLRGREETGEVYKVEVQRC